GPLDPAGAVALAAEVVDDDLRAFLRKEQRVRPADAAAGTRDDCDLAFETTHRLLLRYKKGDSHGRLVQGPFSAASTLQYQKSSCPASELLGKDYHVPCVPPVTCCPPHGYHPALYTPPS